MARPSDMGMEGSAGIAGPLTLNRSLRLRDGLGLCGCFSRLWACLARSQPASFRCFLALFLRYLTATIIIFFVLRRQALQTLRNIGRLELLRVGSVLISQFSPLLLSEPRLTPG